MHAFAQKQSPTQQANPACSATRARKSVEQKIAEKTSPPSSTARGRTDFARIHEVRTVGTQTAQRSLQDRAGDLQERPDKSASTGFAYDLSRVPVRTSSGVRIQPKLKVNSPGDVYEQEADRVADQVMRMPEPTLQRACACGGACPECKTEDQELVQTKPNASKPRGKCEQVAMRVMRSTRTSNGAKESAARVPSSSSSKRSNLDSNTKSFMEARFATNFDQVRVHTGRRAAKAAMALDARAFAIGPDIYFGSGEYRPHTSSGRRLLAHELTHVVQQGHATPKVQRQETGTSNELTDQASPVPTGDSIAPVVDEADRSTRTAITVIEAALTAADGALAEQAFPDEKLARIRVQADKLRPMLDAYRKVERGEQPAPGLTLDFDPVRDQIDEGDADMLAQSEFEDSGSVGAGSPQVFASRTERGLVSMRAGGADVQRVVCGGLCIGGAIALGALLLSGCSQKKKPTLGLKAVTNADGKGWLTVRHSDGSTYPPLPQYLKVDHTSTSGDREYFTLKESGRDGRLIDSSASVKQKSGRGSYLASGLTYKGAAAVTFDTSTGELRYGGRGPVATITMVSNPVPTGTHDLEIPYEQHPGGGGYEASSVYAKTWFRVGHSGDRFLHPGSATAGCATVTGVSEWTSIYMYLINSRKDNKNVGTITVT